MVYICWEHKFNMDGGSHSWHVHPSASVIWYFDICLGRHCECIHRIHRSNCMRLTSPGSPFPRRQCKHGE